MSRLPLSGRENGVVVPGGILPAYRTVSRGALHGCACTDSCALVHGVGHHQLLTVVGMYQ